MNFTNRLGKICDALGTNPKATYPVMLIALVKGICRPTFTMMDKTEKPETKKYTALREGLTEFIAIPTYLVCGEVAARIAKKLKFKNVPPDVNTSLVKRASKNMMFIGVCTAALFIIPALCSVAIKPIMDKFMPQKPKNNKPQIDTNMANKITTLNKPDINSFADKSNPIKPIYNNRNIYSGMKVGGV